MQSPSTSHAHHPVYHTDGVPMLNALHGKPVVFMHFLLIVCSHVIAVSTHASSVLARLNMLKQLVIRHASM